MKRIIFIAAIGLLMTACQSDENNVPEQSGDQPEEQPGEQPQEELDLQPVNIDWNEVSFTSDEQEMTNRNNAFAFDLLRQVASDKEEKNIFLSPLSATLALTMTSNGADGTTLTEMQNTLGWKEYSREAINEYCRKLAWGLQKADPKTELNIANSIWVRDEYHLQNGFVSDSWNYYNAELSAVDFASPEALITINQWCSDHTNGRINPMLTEGNIDGETIAILINALYFNGVWTSKFDKEDTVLDYFYNADGKEMVTNMMRQSLDARYLETQDVSLIELPYGNGMFSMVIVVPAWGKALDTLVAGLATEQWRQWIAGMEEKEVQLMMPSFTLKCKRELTGDLQALGMKKAFSLDAEFPNMLVERQNGLSISKVLQKPFVSVTEDGTEAAAATAVVMDESVGGSGVYFSVNRPFLYMIKEKKSGAILFIGRMKEMEPV